jgi:hypothetical protein
MRSGIADVEAQETFGVCLVSITRGHEREYRELERLKRNLLRERKWSECADSANFLANLTVLRVNEFVSPLRQIISISPLFAAVYNLILHYVLYVQLSKFFIFRCLCFWLMPASHCYGQLV